MFCILFLFFSSNFYNLCYFRLLFLKHSLSTCIRTSFCRFSAQFVSFQLFGYKTIHFVGRIIWFVLMIFQQQTNKINSPLHYYIIRWRNKKPKKQSIRSILVSIPFSLAAFLLPIDVRSVIFCTDADIFVVVVVKILKCL